MSEVTKIRSIHLAHHLSEDEIDVSYVEKPYGDYSDPIIKLDIKEFDGKLEVKIPYSKVDELIQALKNSKEVYDKTTHPAVHAELGADIGGGQ